MVKLKAFVVLLAVSSVAVRACEADYENEPSNEAETTRLTGVSSGSLPHWVGPSVGSPKYAACYRKTYPAKNKKCPRGFEFDKIATCWTECPLEYPVECGMECLPQNQKCSSAVLRKVTSVVNVAMNVASGGLFGQLTQAKEAIEIGVRCGQSLMTTVQKITTFLEKAEAAQANSTSDQVKFLDSNSDLATRDLPNAISTCLGQPVPEGVEEIDAMAQSVKVILQQLVELKSSGENMLDPKNLIKLVANTGVSKVLHTVDVPELDKMKDLITNGASCGGALKDILDQIVSFVEQVKKNDSSTPTDSIRLAVMGSDLVLKELPNAASSCFNISDPAAFKKRDQVLKAGHVLIDGVVGSSSVKDKPVSSADFAMKVSDMGLDFLSTLDPTGIADMAQEFVQPICGPTLFLGEIEDGPADKALGLRAVDYAFEGSNGQWKQQGDGVVSITLRSEDSKDVVVVIRSGGDELDKVKVAKGATVKWQKPLSGLQGKTMYLDRRRPGFLGIPGSGGSSLLLWIPDNAGGSLSLDVPINASDDDDNNGTEDAVDGSDGEDTIIDVSGSV
ncbi:hypothetical protein Poli38472_011647 [Pythium oligandrum]|uniref:Uncharacterized protein n=1 Tax=Pythium oligandrum TaxID=41045 RepID=A0A8K1CLZ2_PYTOL|nr:hypothetical protein Poli38472_011647 [Pythium oligandrum]|eukprot:TMW64767.1 hypothetical protein Poli38472_011647 [Pythium oligandrum]